MTTWVVDLDGVMWQGSSPVPGSAAAIERLLNHGHRVVFCTNHAASPAGKRAQLDRQGVPDAPVVSSAESAAAMVHAGQTVLVLGTAELPAMIATSGATVIDVRTLTDGPAPPADVVVLGMHDDWNRTWLGIVADSARAGATYLVTNDDPTFPATGRDGLWLLPGCGALAAAVSVASGATPTFAGKPFRPMADLLTARSGPVDWVVGDQPSTDGRLATALDAKFALVLTGATTALDAPAAGADLVAADLAGVVEAVLAS